MSRLIHRTARRFSVVVALTVGFAAAGPLASVAGAAAPGAPKPKAVAALKIMKPSVLVKKKGAKNFTPAKDGQQLHEGDSVQTDAKGLAEVDYSDNSYTRLDVSTTVKIVKLSDDQGNRKVNTSVDVGRTWNRTAQLTESQSFEQGGAGATAAVVGTAFAVECDPIVAPATESHHCTTIAVIHTTEWTGADGTKLDLGPYESCDATDGVICNKATKLAAFDEWILRNLYLDLLLRGLSGPVSGVVAFQGGRVIFIPTTTPTTTTTGISPVTTPNVLGSPPIGCEFGCNQSSSTFGLATGFPTSDYVAGSAIVVDEGGGYVDFVANLTVETTGYFIVFDTLPGDDGHSVGTVYVACGCSPVVKGQQYDAAQIFRFVGDTVDTSSLSFHIEDAARNHAGDSGKVPVSVTPTTGCGTCDYSLAVETTTTPSTDPPTATSSSEPPTTTTSTSPPSG